MSEKIPKTLPCPSQCLQRLTAFGLFGFQGSLVMMWWFHRLRFFKEANRMKKLNCNVICFV